MTQTIHHASLYRTLIKLAILLQSYVINTVTSCPCRYCGPTTLCHRMNLREVPYTIPTSEVVRLLLYGNQIKKLTHNEFQGMRRVVELDLHGNQIRVVEAQAFVGLESLESLHLSENEIEYIPAGALKKMPKLSRLFLDKNKLKRLPEDIPYLHGLTRLNLGLNEITSMAWNSFFSLNKMESLIIWSNPLHCDCEVHEMIRWFTSTSKGLSIGTDAINFLCKEEDVEDECRETKILKVTQLPLADVAETSQQASAATYVQSDSAYLNCNVTGKPRPLVAWKTPSSGYVYPYSTGRLTAYTNGTLVIHSLRLTDAGKYSCQPRRAGVFTETSSAFQLKVVRGSRPRVRALKEKLQASGGSKVQLHCSGVGNPSPSIRWYAPNTGRPLGPSNFTATSSGARFSSNKNGTTLTIPNFAEKDAGLWKCRASNSMGFDAAYIQVGYMESSGQLLIIIIAVACAAVVTVIVAVVVVTCLVRRRRRRKRKRETNAGQQTSAANNESSPEQQREAANVNKFSDNLSDAALFTASNPENQSIVILQQPYTKEPTIRGIRI